MPKTLAATDLTIEGLHTQTDETGAINGLTATVNVAYGESRAREEFDLWAELTATQKSNFQAVYDRLNLRRYRMVQLCDQQDQRGR